MPRRPDAALDGVHWAAHAREPHVPHAALDTDLDVDVAVVGGGYTGLSAAREAARCGASVALLEAGRIGCGASGRNGGFVVPHFPGSTSVSDVVAAIGARKGEALAAEVTSGPDRVLATIQRYQIEADVEQNGWLQPAHSARSLAKVRRVFEDWRAFGADVTWLDETAVGKMTGTATYRGGWTRPNGATVNPAALARGLGRAAANEGALLFEASPVDAIARDGQGSVLSVGAHTVRARAVVLATNGYTEQLIGGEARALIPVQLFHTMTAPLDEAIRAKILPTRACFTDIRRSGGFARYDRDGRLISGGLVFAPLAGRASFTRHAQRRMGQIFPGLGTPPLEAWWTGWCAVTDNGLPRVQRLAPNVFSVAGYATRGVCMAQIAGAALGRVVGGEGELADLPFEVHEGAAEIPLHTIKALGAKLIFPYYVALDRVRLS
ncbi:FAD-dependent oxidoreductase [Acuticoccus sp. MNP-M23]|uniref:NAD(P)/FAD-dependent oxidoreductase n=1 Tax=Acuticoccus sp. MNP-M23 TaxID=3072793 RepID=UPI00281646BD|nr:FAD-dependent oxidoreductase [Acuticoccus sp. MNP-M23]WMS42194.1 FAD-dependent oxidoreductase [Acuticoccus sp. MNP-M23]